MRAGGWGYIRQTVCESLSEATTPPPTQVPKWMGGNISDYQQPIQLDMDVAQNQLPIAMNQRRRGWKDKEVVDVVVFAEANTLWAI